MEQSNLKTSDLSYNPQATEPNLSQINLQIASGETIGILGGQEVGKLP